MILKDLLPLRKDLKVILMSATLNANLFCKYFGNPPMIEIPGKDYNFIDKFFFKYQYTLFIFKFNHFNYEGEL